MALFKRSKRSEVIKNPEETQDFIMLYHAKGLTPLNRINLCKAFYMLCGHGLQIRAIGINLCKAFYMLCGHGLQIRAIGIGKAIAILLILCVDRGLF